MSVANTPVQVAAKLGSATLNTFERIEILMY